MGPPILVFLGASVLLALGIAALRAARRRADDRRLDRPARQRVELRLSEIRQPVDPANQSPQTGSPAHGHALAGSRRRLWRDTSAILVFGGIGLILILAVANLRAPTGGVLEATATPAPSLVVSPSPAPTSSTDAVTPAATPISKAPAASSMPRPANLPPGATADRMAVLSRCPGEVNCFLYSIRKGDNLSSIANWFGIPYSTVLAMNPEIRDRQTLHAGESIMIPAPTR